LDINPIRNDGAKRREGEWDRTKEKTRRRGTLNYYRSYFRIREKVNSLRPCERGKGLKNYPRPEKR